MERDSKLPTTIVELEHRGVESSQWTVDKYEYAGNRNVFSLERFNYTVFDSVVVVRDLFYGTHKKFLPANSIKSIRLLRYIYLALNRAFVVYESDSSINASIISLDFHQGLYSFISHSREIFKFEDASRILIDDVSHAAEHTVTVKTEDSLLGATLHVFEVNRRLSAIISQKTYTLPDYCQWFTIIDEKIVFAKLGLENRIDRCYLDNFMVLDLNNSSELTEIDDTSTCMQAKFCVNDWIIYPCGIQGVWHEDRFFVLCNFCPGDRSNPTTAFMSVFELKTRRWSELCLNLPQLNQGFVKFNVDYNGILHILHHAEVFDDKELSHTNVTSIRIPLKKPDKLIKLALFKARQSPRFDLKKLPYNFVFHKIF